MKLLTARHGFTLIELMLSVAVVGILFSSGISAYTKSQRSQAVKSTAEKILIILQSAQKKTIIGDKDCTGALDNYEVKYVSGASSITTTAKCTSNSGSVVTDTLTNVSFVGNGTLNFRPLGAGVSFAGGGDSQNIDFRYGAASTTYRLSISKSGSISYLGEI